MHSYQNFRIPLMIKALKRVKSCSLFYMTYNENEQYTVLFVRKIITNNRKMGSRQNKKPIQNKTSTRTKKVEKSNKCTASWSK